MTRVLRPVAPGVLFATSRRDRTNSIVVRSRRRREVLLIDPAWTPDELSGLARALRARAFTVTAGFATHAHFDHLLWHPAFGDPPRYATAGTARRAAAQRSALLAELGPGVPRSVVDRLGAVTAVPGGVLPVASPNAVVLEHDGHEPGSSALWLEEGRVLVAGDLLSDSEIPLLGPDADRLAGYVDALDRLAPFVRAARLVIPGHGGPTRAGLARLDADRRYLDALAAGRTPHDHRLADPAMARIHAAQATSGGATP